VSQSRDLTQTSFTLDGNISELSRLAAEIGKFCAANALGDDAEFSLNVSLDELFTNAVRHGGCAGVPAAVAIHLDYAGGAVRVGFRDRGIPFDPLSVPPPNLAAPLEERTPGGLGIHFVRQLMRGVQYHRSEGWNCIAMELPLPAVPEAQEREAEEKG